MTTTYRRIVLQRRPDGAPALDNFRLEHAPIPQPADGQVLLKNHFLSLDPYMRGRMSDTPSYAPPVALDAVMVGATVSRVAASRHPAFNEGDLVVGMGGWQTYTLSDGSDISLIDSRIQSSSLALSVLGMTGFTAYHGLLKIGEPKAGETVVVAAATGAVGSVVGQIARLKGARAVGVAGREDKCRYAVESLGFDVCLDHHAADFCDRLAAATPEGIDVYYENVGGKVFDAVMPRLNVGARVPVCGLISHYNGMAPSTGGDRLPQLIMNVLTRRWRIQGFIIADHYADGWTAFLDEMTGWVNAGQVKIREEVVDGLEQAPQAFLNLLAGKNFGKVVVRLADPA